MTATAKNTDWRLEPFRVFMTTYPIEADTERERKEAMHETTRGEFLEELEVLKKDRTYIFETTKHHLDKTVFSKFSFKVLGKKMIAEIEAKPIIDQPKAQAPEPVEAAPEKSPIKPRNNRKGAVHG